jgi:hypothetical protein
MFTKWIRVVAEIPGGKSAPCPGGFTERPLNSRNALDWEEVSVLDKQN